MTDDQDKVARKKAATKASRIRRKAAAGKELTERETAFLASWNAQKSDLGRPTKDEPIDSPPPPAQASEAPAAAEKPAPSPSPAPAAAGSTPWFKKPDPNKAGKPEPGKVIPIKGSPPPAPPPRVLRGASSGGDWRAKYQSNVGREGTCIQVAALWATGLKRLSRSIEANGGKPIFDEKQIDQALYPAMVLTVDRVMPAKFDMGPEVTASAGSSALLIQAWWKSRQAKAAEDEKAKVKTEPTREVVKAPAPKVEPPKKPAIEVVERSETQPVDEHSRKPAEDELV